MNKTKAKTANNQKKAEVGKPNTKPATLSTKTKSNAVKTKSVSPVTNAGPLKKDGTPDKRFAANKHLKKDGSKDMRYKENKTTTKTKSK
ncbi:MAG: hypothetical protein IT248_11275 [Chitinophagaceae bacterium]|nr:hypothetical protein [Chitinophagaceae bacterium]